MKKLSRLLLSGFSAMLLCVSALADAESLHIMGMRQEWLNPQHTRYAQAVKRMREQHPGLRIAHLSPQQYGDVDWAQDMATADPAVDILCLTTPNLQRLIAQDVLLNLSERPALQQTMADWPDVSRLMGKDGAWYALPLTVFPRLCVVGEPEVYEALHLQMPPDWLWEDLFSVAPALADYNKAHGTSIALMNAQQVAPYFLHQFVANTFAGLPLDQQQQETLRTLLGDWKQAADRGLIARPDNFSQTQGALFSFVFPYRDELDKLTVLPAPAYAKDIRRSEVSMEVMVVNAASPRAQAAVDFLTYFSAGDKLPPAGLADQPDDAMLVSAEHAALWDDAVAQGFSANSGFGQLLAQLNELLLQFEANAIDLDACLEGMIELMQ